MASFTAGTTFVDGVSNDVTAAKLGNLVTNATPTSGFIQDRTAETVVGTNDTILIGDASDSNNLKRMTVANILKAPLVSTSGTIDNLTTGTTTSTNEVVTTGTITNLSATTSTFLGAITGSTNVVNIGSGQIYKDASGNVGIGDSSPTSKLEIATASTTAYGLISRTPVVGLTAGDYVNMAYFSDSRGDSNDGLRIVNIRDSTGTGVGDWPTSSFRIRRSVDQSNAASGVQEEIVFGNDLLAFRTASAERLRIDASGNVGIATGGTAAASKLDVYGVGNFQSIELGKSGQTGNRDCLIDFTGDDTYSDYGLRIIRNSTGSNAESVLTSKGTGGLFLKTEEAGPIGFQTTNTERLRIDSSGNVGIGTASPSNKLSITNYTSAVTAGGQALEVYSDSNHRAYLTQNSAAGSQSAFLSHGARWLNTTGTYTAEKTVASFGSPAILLDNENFNGIKFLFKAGGATVSDGSVSNLMTILSSGNVGIGTTGPTATLHSVSASASTAAGIFQVTATSGTSLSAVSVIKQDALNTTNQNFVLFQVGGGATSSGKINANGANAAAFGSTSDSRLKENITALPSQLDNVCALKPCEFDYKDGSGHQIGFIAQEMQQIYPDSVGVGDDGMLTITAWSKTEARLVKAIQELKSKNDSLEARLQALEAK